MKKAHFEFEEIPFSTLARFGLTQEMIEDLPMHVLDDIYNGRHSPVLPVRVTDEHGETVESRTRFALIRMEGGQTDVVFYPALKSSPLERFDETQQKQLADIQAAIPPADEEAVLYIRTEIENEGAVPRYAWIKAPRPAMPTNNLYIGAAYQFDREKGFSFFHNQRETAV